MTHRPEICATYYRACRHLGYCTKTRFLQLHAKELVHSEIVRAARLTVYRVTNAKNIKPMGCRDWLYDELWKARVQTVNRKGHPVEPDMDCFEPSDAEIDNGMAHTFDERLRDFFRSNACNPPSGGRVFVTKRWHRHFTTMATIIGASHPEVAQWWPRMIDGKYVDPRAANDDRPPRG